MASIIERLDVKVPYYRVRIRKKGYPFFSISFETREEAEKWILKNEDGFYHDPYSYIREQSFHRKLVHRFNKRKKA